jgi:uncharacterized protein YuzE
LAQTYSKEANKTLADETSEELAENVITDLYHSGRITGIETLGSTKNLKRIGSTKS